ncbi:hypothetical protein [Pseudomonas chlororaphis]|uniref:hypothetical protein n=1 Tax=Pseudomonas chlororaphis TaxID=587753 RepID=UPI0018AF9C11|nr:hypothetical protein [Pseudomonas chlororaphis]
MHQHLSLRDGPNAASGAIFLSKDTALLGPGIRLEKDRPWSGLAREAACVSTELLQAAADRPSPFSTSTQGDVEFSNDLPSTELRIQVGSQGQMRKSLSVNSRIGLERSTDNSELTSISGSGRKWRSDVTSHPRLVASRRTERKWLLNA